MQPWHHPTEFGDTVRQANALKELQRILYEVTLLTSNDSFMSGQSHLVNAHVALLKVETAWLSENANLRGEV